MKKILFTGFEPFDGAATNPSWDAVSLLPEEIDGCRISRILLPVEYDSVGSLLDAAIAKEQPDTVICVGQAGGRSAITPEMVAINLKDASIPDNAGISYDGVPILEGAPAAYFATIPVKSIAPPSGSRNSCLCFLHRGNLRVQQPDVSSDAPAGAEIPFRHRRIHPHPL